MSRAAPLPDDVLALLGRALRPQPGTLQVDEVTDSFPWARKHRLFVGYDHTGRAMAVARPVPAGAPVLLAAPGGDELAPLSALLVAERGSLPGGLTPLQLAEAVRRLTHPHPMGRVGDDAMLVFRVLPPGQPPGERDRTQALREAGAREPTLTPRGAGSYRLAFSYWVPSGAVESWSVDLGPTAFGRVERGELAPAGTFRYPFV